MDVRNCKSCGKIFNYLSGPPICPSCARQLDAKFELIKEYVYDHPRVDMKEVSEEFDVSIAQIKQWIREERLSFADDSLIGIDCESCGITIKTGRYCKSCKDKMTKRLSEAYKPEKQGVAVTKKDPRENPKMRFLDK